MMMVSLLLSIITLVASATMPRDLQATEEKYQFMDLNLDEMNAQIDKLVGPFASVKDPNALFDIGPSTYVSEQF